MIRQRHNEKGSNQLVVFINEPQTTILTDKPDMNEKYKRLMKRLHLQRFIKSIDIISRMIAC